MKIKTSIFIKSIISLIFSQVLIKIFGLIYTLYLTNKNGFGDRGNAIYMSGYQIYSLMLTVSSIGIPNAIAKLVAEKEALRDFKNSKRILYVSSILFGFTGFLGTVLLYFKGEFIAVEVLGISEACLSIKMLSPAVFFVSMGAVLRGYFNGKNYFKIGAKSQILEQIVKTILTILFLEYVGEKTDYDVKMMASSVSMGTTLSTIISFLYIVKIYYKEERLSLGRVFEGTKESSIYILKRILVFSFPIMLSAIISSLSKNIDSITIVRILKDIVGESMALEKYGILSSKIDILIALPLSINSSIALAIIPTVSEKIALNDINKVEEKIIEAIDITCLIAIPCMFGMMFYSKEIFDLLFPNARTGYELLSVASIGIIFLSLIQTINGILQALNKNYIYLFVSIVGIFVKVISNILLIRIEGIYEMGAVIGNVLSGIVSFIIVNCFLHKNIKLSKGIIKISSTYIISSILMIILSKNLLKMLSGFFINLQIISVISIGISAIFYAICVVFIKIFQKNVLKSESQNP